MALPDGIRSGYRALKRGALTGADRAGVLRRVRDSGWRRERLLILCYHGIAMQDEHGWRPSLYMPPAFFEERLRILRDEGYRVLPLADALERLYAGNLPERSVAITFDDGDYDFYQEAFPRLRAYDFPATVYLTTHYSDRRLPIFHLTCSYLLWKRRSSPPRICEVGGATLRLDLGAEQSREHAVQLLSEHAEREGLSTEDKNELARALAAELDIDYDRFLASRILQLMNAREVAEIAEQGIDFQLHTHRHRSPRDPALYRRELHDNRASIQAKTERTPLHFCYPSGEYTAEHRGWLAEEGVVSATTCDPGLATAATDPLLLPRLVDTTGVSPAEFRGWLSGAATFLPRRRSYASG